MSKIIVTASSYPGTLAHVNGTTEVDVTVANYMWASLTLGAQGLREFSRSHIPILGFQGGLGFAVRSMLTSQGGYLCLSPNFVALDSSMKGLLSYWNGMVLAKIVASKLLQVPWLSHVDSMKKRGHLTTSTFTKRRGDLVGKSSQSEWHVIEAKGRSGDPESGLLADAKFQASLIQSVHGIPPAFTSACISQLSPDRILVTLDDPPRREGDKAESWNFSEAQFFRHYYEPIIDYIRMFRARTKPKQGLDGYSYAPIWPWLNEPEIFIGLPVRIVERDEPLGEMSFASGSRSEGAAEPDGFSIIGAPGNWDEANRS